MLQAKSTDVKNQENLNFMLGVNVLFFEPGIGKKRIEILLRQLLRYGGEKSTKLTDDVTHIIVNKNVKIAKLCKSLGVETIRSSCIVLDADWLSSCYMECKQCDVTPYLLRCNAESNETSLKNRKVTESEEVKQKGNDAKHQNTLTLNQKEPNFQENTDSSSGDTTLIREGRKRKCLDYQDSNSDSSYVDSGDEAVGNNSPKKLASSVSPTKPEGSWVCTKPSTSVGENLNEHITQKLEVLAREYENTQDRWRALGYKKAISAIKNYPKQIETAEEVRQLPFVGDRLAKKIIEILETGYLRRLDHQRPNIDIINLFADVWGAGPKTAEAWVAQGFRTLDDLREKAELNFQQKIGLKHYQEFLDKMPRSEVEEIEQSVRETVCSLIPGTEVQTCGSYRRGRKACGDIDILVSHPDGRSHKGLLAKLLDALQATGLITDDLITVDNEEQRKYMGVCKLPGESRKHRRIDIIVAPYSEWACALVHFTGSGRLNRSMRQLAKTKGMSLSEHALREGVIRKGQEKLHKGTVIPTFSEEDIFRHLGLDYLEPHERDW